MLIPIAAVATNGVIGKDNAMPWDTAENQAMVQEDLARFKALTKGHPIVMGLNTFLSILKRMEEFTGKAKMLPGRTHFVLSSKSIPELKELICSQFPTFEWEASLAKLIFSKSAGAATQRAESLDEEVYIIGGTRVYGDIIPFASKMEITEIDGEFEGDAFFPNIDENIWKREVLPENERQGYRFVTYYRR